MGITMSMRWVVLLLLALSGVAHGATPVRLGNLLEEGGWEQHSARKQGGSLERDAAVYYRIGPSYRLRATQDDDQRFTQSIQVVAGHYYRFRAMVKTAGVQGRVGANLSVYGTNNHSRQTLTGDSDWTRIEQVFRALADANVEFALRLGHGSRRATGSAWFDVVELEELAAWDGDYEPIVTTPRQRKRSSSPLRLLAFLFFVPFLYGSLAALRRHDLGANGAADTTRPVTRTGGFWLLLGLALLARLAFVGYAGFSPQLDYYQDWARALAGSANLLDAPLIVRRELSGPLWLVWLSAVGAVVKATLLEGSVVFTMLIKLPAVVLEMVLIYLLLARMAAQLPRERFWWQACFLAFNPAMIMVTAFWGQPVAVTALLMWLALALLLRSRPGWAALAFGGALAMHPMSAIFLPVIAFVLLRQEPRRDIVRYAVIASLTCIVLYVPAPAHLAVSILLPAPTDTLFAWQTELWQWLGFCVLLAGLSFVVWWRAQRYLRVIDGYTYLALSYLVALLAALLLPWLQDLSLYLALVFLVPLLTRHRGYRWSFLVITVMLFVKLAYLFAHLILNRYGIPGEAVFTYVIVATVLVLILAELRRQWLPTAPHSFRWHRAQTRLREYWLAPRFGPPEPFALTKFDYLALAALWALGLSLTLYGLGEWRYPIHGLKSAAGARVLEVVLEEPQKLTQARVYIGANGVGNVRFEYWDGEQWRRLWREGGGRLRYRSNREYRSTFKALRKRFKSKQPIERLRLTISGDGFDVNEVAVFGEDGKPIMPSQILLGQHKAVYPNPRDHPLFDEQSRITNDVHYRARTIWDEVHYARTAYEFSNGLQPDETTHPPFGKTLIALGVRLFDMTPFGWRFSCALFVSFLTVLAFVGGRWLTTNRVGAYVAAVLSVCELMYFNHGRWANVDTFLVVLLTASLLCLYRWVMLGHKTFDRPSIGWFFASGVFLGLAAATKWNALFIGFAIFVMLCIAKLNALNQAMHHQRAGAQGAVAGFFKGDLLPSIGHWALGFLVIPALMYYLAHFELLQALPNKASIWTTDGVRTFIEQQQHMWSFHADRDSTHSGSSLFFTWPIMWRPLWMYTPGGIAEGMHASINMIGNPMIWWPGFIVMLGLAWVAVAGKDRTALFLAGVYFLQCLPWLVITRTMFIYHYYPFLPLVIWGIAYTASRMNYDHVAPRAVLAGYILLVIAAFAAYYPLLTAMPVPSGYVEALRLLDTWPLKDR